MDHLYTLRSCLSKNSNFLPQPFQRTTLLPSTLFTVHHRAKPDTRHYYTDLQRSCILSRTGRKYCNKIKQVVLPLCRLVLSYFIAHVRSPLNPKSLFEKN